MKFETIPLNIVSEDGVIFLKRLPDSSAVVFTFGIEPGAVICDKQYMSKLENEVKRVMSKEGYILTSNSIRNDIPIESELSEIIRGKNIPDAAIKKIEVGEKKELKEYRLE